MKNKKNKFVSILVLFLAINALCVTADDFSTVSPSLLNLELNQSETVIEKVSIKIHPLCFRAYNVDVVSSIPDALVTNLTGEIVNGCGNDTSTFEIEFTGAEIPQLFDLQFVDADFGGILGSIPVTINTPASTAESLLGLFIRQNAIVFQVSSSGCTTKDDFKVEVLESFPLQLRLIRFNEDPCDAFLPLGTKIRFTYREIGIRRGDQCRVINPLATVEVPPRIKR